MIAIIVVILRQLRKVTRCPQVLIPDYVLLRAILEGVVTNSLWGFRVASLVAGYTVDVPRARLKSLNARER